MLAKGAPHDEPDEDSLTPVLKAAQSGHADCIIVLLRAEPKVHLQLLLGCPQLLLILEGRQQARSMLFCDVLQGLGMHPHLDACAPTHLPQADIHRKVPGSLKTALLLAASGAEDIHALAVEVLLQHGALVEDKDADGNSAMLLACAAGNVAVLLQLLACGAGVDTANAAGVRSVMVRTLMCRRCAQGHADARLASIECMPA